MAERRDAHGRFTPKPRDELSPAYRRRLERGEARGMPRSEARGHGTAARRVWETGTLVGSERYERALEVVGRMRRGESLSAAAHAVSITPDTVLRYAGSALARNTRGRVVAKPTDRLVRRMRFLDERGAYPVEPATSKEARKLAEYHNAVQHFLTTGDDRPLRRFRRMRLRTRQKASLRFLTDPAALERLGRAGELSFEDLYEH